MKRNELQYKQKKNDDSYRYNWVEGTRNTLLFYLYKVQEQWTAETILYSFGLFT